MYYIGLMSGTSMDAVDVALVDFDEDNISITEYNQIAIPSKLKHSIRSINSSASIYEITELDVIIGKLFADAVNKTLLKCTISPDEVCAIGSHGQTVLHLMDTEYPRSLQIGDPNIIAHQTGITTIGDFRRKDIAAGGQGAPLACAFHAWKFRSQEIERIVLNIGGMANITILPSDPGKNITGFDTGPGNALMDDWIQKHLHLDYDKDGEWALKGVCNEQILNQLLDEKYFSSEPPKSTGKDYFNFNWIEKKLSQAKTVFKPEDIQATLLSLTAITVCNAINKFAPDTTEILVCGGGVHNPLLLAELKKLLPGIGVITTLDVGLNPDSIEAVAFAWLAKQRLENIPGNIPSVTGAIKPVVLGSIYSPD